MRLAPPPLAITDDEGFERDIFGAKEAGERLANVVTDLEGHSVIVLDGGWEPGRRPSSDSGPVCCAPKAAIRSYISTHLGATT